LRAKCFDWFPKCRENFVGAHVLEVVRQPMDDKVITISRAKGFLTFSSNF
jgi:predicted ATPase with chaperone activity